MKKKQVRHQKATPPGKSATFLELDDEIKHEFKVWCVRNRTTMTEVINAFMRDVVLRAETEDKD
jgi:hypothetical protein